MSLKTYRAVSAFAQGNTRYDKGVILSLTDKQATYLLSGGFIELVPVVETAAPPVAAPASPAPATSGEAGGSGGTDTGAGTDAGANPPNGSQPPGTEKGGKKGGKA